jgi:hypothetical protein
MLNAGIEGFGRRVVGEAEDVATADAGQPAGPRDQQEAQGPQPGMARFPSVRFMVEADLRGWLPLMGVVLTEDQIQRILQEAQHALGAYVTAAGTMAFELSAHLIRATRS